MKFLLATCSVLYTVFLMSTSTLVGAEPQPKFFTSVKLLYQDEFHGGQLDLNHWQVRQGTTWKIQDGVLAGSPSPKEYQEKKVAEGDKAHAGFKPVIWLEKVPENLLVQFRVRFDAKAYQPKFPLIDVGHHVNSLMFSENGLTLVLKKDQKTIEAKEISLPLNTWADVIIELKRGAMRLQVNNKQVTFEDPLIDMVGQQQIDFKGIDHGGIQIDDVKVYEGIP
jgi:hypothetical protein